MPAVRRIQRFILFTILLYTTYYPWRRYSAVAIAANIRQLMKFGKLSINYCGIPYIHDPSVTTDHEACLDKTRQGNMAVDSTAVRSAMAARANCRVLHFITHLSTLLR